MQVLKDSKLKFVSAVGVCLLDLSVFLTAPGVILTLKTKKKTQKTSCWFYTFQSSFAGIPGSCRQRRAGLHCFPFLWFFKDGGLVWATIMTGVVSSPCPQSTVWPELSTLCICARPLLIIHLVLPPFDQSVKCTEWEQILPLCWPGPACTWVRSLPWCSVILLRKLPFGATCHS